MYLLSTENWAVRGQLRRSQLHVSEKAMAPHSSTLAWKIPWTEEPGGLQSLGSGESDTTSLSLFIFMNWRRNWLPTPVFLPGESQGQGSLEGCRLWGRTESDTTEATQQQYNTSEINVIFQLSLNFFNEPNLFFKRTNKTEQQRQKQKTLTQVFFSFSLLIFTKWWLRG